MGGLLKATLMPCIVMLFDAQRLGSLMLFDAFKPPNLSTHRREYHLGLVLGLVLIRTSIPTEGCQILDLHRRSEGLEYLGLKVQIYTSSERLRWLNIKLL